MAKRTQRTKPEPISNREAITDAVCEVMQASYRDQSIDALVCRPFDAIAMAVRVAVKTGTCKRDDAKAFMSLLDDATNGHPLVPKLNEICRTAMSARKRGDLRTDKY